ncbi:MAG: hypothetical protein VW775_07355 [Schleiferiaceae bacterium]
MRRFILLVFTLFYTVVSTGAVGLLHFCQHESSVHLGITHEDHHTVNTEPSCCHTETSSCGTETEKSEEDCCETTYTSLDLMVKSSEVSVALPFITPEIVQYTERQHIDGPILNTTRVVQSKGPPLYIALHRLTLYA